MDSKHNDKIWPVMLSSIPESGYELSENKPSQHNSDNDLDIKIKSEPLDEDDVTGTYEYAHRTFDLDSSENRTVIKIESNDLEASCAVGLYKNLCSEENLTIAKTEIIENEATCSSCAEGPEDNLILKTEINDNEASRSSDGGQGLDLQTVEKHDPESTDASLSAASSCEVCTMDFDNQSSFTEHMLIEHSKYLNEYESESSDNDTDDEKCAESSSSVENECRSTDQNSKSCTHCTQSFNSRETLSRHMTSSHHEHECEDSAASCSYQKNFYECKLCDKRFRDKFNIKRHFLAVHNSVKKFQCVYEGCERIYKQEWELRRHQRATHSMKCASAFVCPHCGQRFTSTRNLQIHKKFQHEGEHKPDYICQICQKGFHFPWRLKRHLKLVHSTKKPYACSFHNCNKAFKKKKVPTATLR